MALSSLARYCLIIVVEPETKVSGEASCDEFVHSSEYVELKYENLHPSFALKRCVTRSVYYWIGKS